MYAHAAIRVSSSLQVLDRYFGNVCELDLIFNFHKAYHILDEVQRSLSLTNLSLPSLYPSVSQSPLVDHLSSLARGWQ